MMLLQLEMNQHRRLINPTFSSPCTSAHNDTCHASYYTYLSDLQRQTITIIVMRGYVPDSYLASTGRGDADVPLLSCSMYAFDTCANAPL